MIGSLYKKLLVLAVLVSAATTDVVAQAQQKQQQQQDTAKIIPFDFSKDLQEQIPPLDSLFVLARLNSPMLKKYQYYNEAQIEKVALAKKSWSSNVQVFGNYAMGNQSLVLSGTASSDLNQLSNGYRFGVNFGLPIYELLTRGNRLTLAKAEANASHEQLEEAEQLLDKEIISTYQQMLAAFRQWRSTQTLVEKSAISEMLAEKKMMQNELSIADYTRVAEIKAQADNRKFESEKLLFDAYYTLQVLIGVPLATIKR